MTTNSTPGAELVGSIVAELAENGLRPTAVELALLAEVSALRDLQADMEAVLDRDGYTTTTGGGTLRPHPLVAEVRQYAGAIARLLGSVSMTDDTAGKNPKKVRAAQQRWANDAKRREGLALYSHPERGA